MYKAIRYIGSKQKVLPFLEENLLCFLKEKNATFFEGFVGTGIVSQYVSENYSHVAISGSDISQYSQVLFNILNIGEAFPDLQKLENIIQEFVVYQENPNILNNKNIDWLVKNELSALGTPSTFNESRNFFHEKTGETIDLYRQFVKTKLTNNEITVMQGQVLLYFILAYACKMANTTSVFGAFLKSAPKFKPFNLKFCQDIIKELNLIHSRTIESTFYHEDIVQSLKEIEKKTVIYLDPPYSTRRYESNYHVLNFIVDLDFTAKEIKNDSKTAQPKLIAENPFGQKKGTEVIFEKMIHLGVEKSEILGISYNSDGVITQTWMENFCQKNGYSLKTCVKEYKRFKSKTEVTNTTQLKEILWLIKKI